MNAKRTISSQGRSLVIKRSIVIYGRRTSISLEDAFWGAFKEIAANKNISLSELIEEINKGRRHSNLSSVIRLFVLDHYRRKAELKRKGN